MKQRIIWQTPDGRIYTGFTVLDYAVPVQEFKTLSEFTEHIQHCQAELIMYYDFLGYVLSHAMHKPGIAENYINSLSVIDNI